MDLRKRAVEVAQQEGKSEAARRFMVSRETVRAWVKRAEGEKLEAISPPGRPRLINPEVEGQLEAQVEGQNDATLAEHCEQWVSQGQAKVSLSTMHRALQRLNYSTKKDRSI